MNIAVLGASQKQDRASYQAVKRLTEAGHTVFPVHPGLDAVDGIKAYARLSDLPEPVDTVSVYLSAQNSDRLAKELVNCGARRVIFNPGAENTTLADRLQSSGMHVIEACTLVLLSSGQFNEA